MPAAHVTQAFVKWLAVQSGQSQAILTRPWERRGCLVTRGFGPSESVGERILVPARAGGVVHLYPSTFVTLGPSFSVFYRILFAPPSSQGRGQGCTEELARVVSAYCQMLSPSLV